ncbi:phage holin family protein [Serratia plymuthica]|uniref:Phage holin family protein n=2 Tax=Serratia plymuthica TaxID=82996 RepID=A0A7T2SR56_SERPL|nr:phage holin family protein [Serratia plymuthica]QPS20144.1 phage holin family protein [Serratia plymuthica]QPS57746.1 phage holin family protein [Serratia plymuthica]QPS61759.1 phage holin family protein [Serratia plymuthica]RKS61154.1 LydA family holin superfamily III [Serratia plymuthica]UNK29920.1 phage holin family protein [Serratia plymuthica]
MMIFTLPKPLPDNGRVFSWLIVGGFSAWGGIVRYLMENKASGKEFSWHEVFKQVVISGFTGFLGGVYGYEEGYSEFMTMVFSGLGGILGGRLLDLLWKRFSNHLDKENHFKH